MSFDAYVVAFGISRLLGELQLVRSASAYLVLLGVGLIDTWLLCRFFSQHGLGDVRQLSVLNSGSESHNPQVNPSP
jgi:hypothetical protein